MFVFDESTGEYQQCVYVAQDQNGIVEGLEQEEKLDSTINIQELFAPNGLVTTTSLNGEQEQHIQEETIVLQEQEQQIVTAIGEEVPEGNGEVIQVLLEGSEDNVIINDENTVPIDYEDQEYLIQCDKCARTFKPQDFERHLDEVHREGPDGKNCSICDKQLNKREYLTHFKECHSDVRLGCPKCPQTYHSPELLNVHYKHFHLKKDNKGVDLKFDETEEEEINVLNLKDARLISNCEFGDVLVTNIDQRLAEHHVQVDTKNDQVKVVPSTSSSSSTSSGRKRPRKSLGPPKPAVKLPLYCSICHKSFETQRVFANHKRRKGFCRPPISEETFEQPKRRIGIIRKSL